MYKFDSYLDFHEFLLEHEHLASQGSVSEFKEAVSNISKGCSCGRNKRVSLAKQKYLNIGTNLDDAFKENLKIILQSHTIFFYHEGSLFLELK